jgi:hypothetical protein
MMIINFIGTTFSVQDESTLGVLIDCMQVFDLDILQSDFFCCLEY